MLFAWVLSFFFFNSFSLFRVMASAAILMSHQKKKWSKPPRKSKKNPLKLWCLSVHNFSSTQKRRGKTRRGRGPQMLEEPSLKSTGRYKKYRYVDLTLSFNRLNCLFSQLIFNKYVLTLLTQCRLLLNQCNRFRVSFEFQYRILELLLMGWRESRKK